MENKLKTVDAETLLSTPMSKTVFIVDNLIPQGVNVISGASKIGKSWLMLWLGLQVAQGLPVWGLTTQHCDVRTHRQRTGGTDYRFFKRPPENKACDYRHLAKGA